MQSLDQETNEEENQQKLAGDFDRPFSPPAQDKLERLLAEHEILQKNHPAFDTGLDEQEAYDEGIEGAAEATGPRKTVVRKYRPKFKSKQPHNSSGDHLRKAM